MSNQSRKNAVLFTLGTLAVTRPGYIMEKVPFANQCSRLYFFASVFVLLVILLRKFTTSTAKSILRIAIPVALYLWLSLRTIIAHGAIAEMLYRLLYYSYCLLLATFGMKKDPKTFLRSVRNVLFVLVVLNAVTIILKPDGLYTLTKMTGEEDNRYWFLGFKNGISKYSVFLITLSGAYHLLTRKAKDFFIFYISFAVSVISAVMIESSGGLVGVCLSFLIAVFVRKTKNSGIMSMARMRNYAIVIACVFATVVLTTSLLTNPLVVYFVTEVLGEKITLSGRLPIWAAVLQIVSQHFIGGVGYLGGEGNARLIGHTANTVDAHDYYLEFLLEGGIIAFTILVLFFLQMTRKLDKYRKNDSVAVLAGGLFTLMLVLIAENCNNDFMWIFFGICLSAEEIERERLKMPLDVVLEKVGLRR